MRNFWILFKVNLINSLKLNKLRKGLSKNRFTQALFPIIAVILALIIIVAIGLFLFMFFGLYIAVEDYYGMLLFGFVVSNLLSLFTTISIANSYLFVSKDYELLMSFPIKPKTIIASKLSNLLILNYILFALLYIPTIIIYGIFTSPGIIFYLLSIVLFIVGPLLVVTIASAISYFLNLLLARLKYKNLIQTVFLFAFFLGFMYLYFKFYFGFIPDGTGQDELELIRQSINRLTSVLEKVFYLGKWAAIGLSSNYLYLLLYIGISIVPFLGFISIVSKNFSKAVARSRISYTNKNFVLTEQKSSGQVKALIKREIKFLFSNASVALNLLTGPLISSIMAFIYIYNSGTFPFELDPRVHMLIVLGITLFMSSTLATTANSISLEGKNLWIIKSAPIEEMRIFTAKILLNLLVALPFFIINTILVTVFFKPGIIDILMFIIIAVLYNLFDGTYSLFINLCFPKLDWDNPVRVVKQSLSSFITIFSSYIVVAGISIAAFILHKIDFTIMYLLISIILIALISVFVIILKTSGIKMFKRLKA